MNDENVQIPNELEEDETAEAMEVVQDTMDKFLDAANVYAVYAKPIQNGDTLIIPSAEVLSGIGFGVGFGSGSSMEEDKPNFGRGSGGGGGGRVLSRPVAVIIATPDEVRVEPVVDATKIALAALTAAGFMMGMVLRMAKGKS
jgi:uncharacterized spore protein YtfJ